MRTEFQFVLLFCAGVISAQDHDACTPAPCMNGGVCVSVGDAYSCMCLAGFVGNDCEQQLDHPARNGLADEPIQSNSAQDDTIDEGRSDSCRSYPCQNGGLCLVMTDGFLCQCTGRFAGATCEHYIGDDEVKEDSIPAVKHVKDSQEDHPPSSDSCSSTPCLNGGRCVTTSDGFLCRCRRSFIGETCGERRGRLDDRQDEDSVPAKEVTDPCASGPCHHNGVCVSRGRRRFRCRCPPGTHGRYCQRVAPVSLDDDSDGVEDERVAPVTNDNGEGIAINACSSMPCMNGGECQSDDVNVYRCICVAGRGGDNCQLND